MGTPRSRRLAGALVVAAALIVSSCSGGSDEGDASASGQAALGQAAAGDVASDNATSVATASLLSVAFDVTDRFGGVGGYAATVAALDRGYTLRQIVDAHRDLDRGGHVVADGEQIPPAGPPQKLLGPAPADDGVKAEGEGDPTRRQSSSEDGEREEYVEFVGQTLGEMWVRIEGRVKWDLPPEQVDRMVDDMVERSRIDAQFDALFADDPDDFAELEALDESEAWATALTLLLVGQGYSLEDALEAGLLGTFEARGPCPVIPGASPETSLRLDWCRDPELDAPTTAAESVGTPVEQVPPPSSGLVDSGLTEWSGEMTPKPGSLTSVTVGDSTVTRDYPVTYPEGFAEVTRLSGTDDFTISIDVTVASAKDYALSGEALQELLDADVIDSFYPNFCETSTNTTFNGVGTFEGNTAASSYFIVFRGEQQRIEVRDCELEDLDPYEDVRESEVWVEVTADGLRVDFSPYEVVFAGPVAPLGG